MLVEPDSLCWVGGRMVEARDGQTWAVEFARFWRQRRRPGQWQRPGQGLKLERAQRRAEGQPDLEDSLDIFHTFRAGGRALRKTWGRAAAPWSEPRRPRRSWTGWAVRENRGRATPH